MIATRPDWCISRQRVWGVPIAVFLCSGCGKALNSPEVNRAVVKMVAEKGVDSWYTPEADSLLPPGTRCPGCGSSSFTREMDIIDVWFESGSSYLVVQSQEPGYPWPADLYTEGGDQHRGWFHSSLLCSIGARNSAPYKAVATSGWTLDEQGRAMHKSLGNDVDPVDIAERLGGEIVRLWVASVDFREDVVGSERLMQRVAENYRKLRNTFRYILGNLHAFDPAQHTVPYEQMEPLDRYMLLHAAELNQQVRAWYERFEFHKIYQRVNQFCVVDLSAFYFDVLKDRLYTYAPNSRGRRSGQTAVWRIGEALVRLLAPLLSFTAEEVWQHLPKLAGRLESVHLAQFPSPQEILGIATPSRNRESNEQQLRSDWTLLRGVRDEVLKALEGARNQKLIGGSLEAQVTLVAPEPAYSVLARYAQELRYLFIVSAVTLESAGGDGASGVRVQVSKAQGQKCERCWNYSTHVGEDADYPGVCERCSAVLREWES
jgi:isoleucyl-tRNA synthetase